MKFHNEHYDAIVSKNVTCNQDDLIDEKTRKSFQEQGVFFTHLLEQKTPATNPTFSDNIQSYPGCSFQSRKFGGHTHKHKQSKPQVEDLGSDMEAEHQETTDYVTSPTYDSKSDYEDPALLEPIEPQLQFEEHYSGTEDAVLDNLSDDPETQFPSPNPSNSWTFPSPQIENESGQDLSSDTTRISSPLNFSDDSISSVFSDSSTASTPRLKPEKYKKNKINEERMARCPVEQVDEIPWDIDGDHVYELPATQNNYMQKYVDGRWFVLKDSTRKGLNGICKIGSCRGSVFCTRGDCPKLTAEGVVNTIDFKKLGHNMYACNSCGRLAKRIYCGVIKMIEFDRQRGTLLYQHQGTHRCHLKPNVPERRKALDDLPIPMSGATKPKAFLHECFQYHLKNDAVVEAFKMCDAVSEADIIDRVKKMRNYPNKTINRQNLLHTFGNIAHIQAMLKKYNHDKFLIYRFECTAMGGKRNYVFKSSELSVELGLKMAGKKKIGEDHSTLIEEPAFFDGMHKRVKNFVTLTMWVFHPAMRAMQILAVMECEHEDVNDIELFFRTFNDAMAEYLNEPGYIWDPCLIMMDEKGANFEAIRRFFGTNFAKTKAKTCQFHFANCGERYISHLPIDYRNTFRNLCHKLCEAYTRDEYRTIEEKIRTVAEKYNFMGWWKFWSPRSPHIVPALRGFGLPKMNLAEVGQSTMRARRKMWLTEAAFKDIAALAFQASKYKKFIENRERIMGKGPTFAQKTARQKADESRYIGQIDKVLSQGDLAAEGERTYEEPYIPPVRAKHCAPRNVKKSYGKAQTEAERNDQDEDVIIVGDNLRKNPQRAKRGKNLHYDEIPVNLNPEPDVDSDAEEHKIMVPAHIEKPFMKANRIYYVVLGDKSPVSRCHGCEGEISEKSKKNPKNMVFLYKLRHPIPPRGGGNGRWAMSSERRNCYFHARDLGCLKLVVELSDVNPSYLYMSNANIKKLTKEHIEELEKRSHWEPILENRRRVRLTGKLSLQ